MAVRTAARVGRRAVLARVAAAAAEIREIQRRGATRAKRADVPWGGRACRGGACVTPATVAGRQGVGLIWAHCSLGGSSIMTSGLFALSC